MPPATAAVPPAEPLGKGHIFSALKTMLRTSALMTIPAIVSWMKAPEQHVLMQVEQMWSKW